MSVSVFTDAAVNGLANRTCSASMAMLALRLLTWFTKATAASRGLSDISQDISYTTAERLHLRSPFLCIDVVCDFQT